MKYHSELAATAETGGEYRVGVGISRSVEPVLVAIEAQPGHEAEVAQSTAHTLTNFGISVTNLGKVVIMNTDVRTL